MRYRGRNNILYHTKNLVLNGQISTREVKKFVPVLSLKELKSHKMCSVIKMKNQVTKLYQENLQTLGN